MFPEEWSGCEHVGVCMRTMVIYKLTSEGGQFERTRAIGMSPSFFIKWENCGGKFVCLAKFSWSRWQSSSEP